LVLFLTPLQFVHLFCNLFFLFLFWPFRPKTKYFFCACAITFQLASNATSLFQ
jgi:hypothetical protein